MIPKDLQWHGPPSEERIRYLRTNYYRDDRLYSETPRDQGWSIGKLFRKYADGWRLVEYDSDGLEIGGDLPVRVPSVDTYRDWLRRMRE